MSDTAKTTTIDGKARAGQKAPGERSILVRGNVMTSGELFSSGREILISHGSENYRLRLTSQNKLILTK
jgi:hemin uptake protein HemP